MLKVDIIVPAYNAAKFLQAALESVVEQTFLDWRIILVDDGSTDETAQIAAVFKQRLGPKMLFLQQENHGLPAARNFAIQNSNAPFLALLDADDVWLPDRLEKSLPSFEDPTIGLSYGFVSLIDAEGRIIRTQDPDEQLHEGAIAAAIYKRSVDLPCPTITFRRACLAKVGEFDESMRASEDRDLWLRIAMEYKVARIPKVIALYRISSGSMSTDIDRMSLAQFRFIEKYRGNALFSRRDYRQALSSVHRQRAEVLGNRGRVWTAFRSMLRALVLDAGNRSNLRTAFSLLYHLPSSFRTPRR